MSLDGDHHKPGWGISERNGVKKIEHGGAQQRVSTYLYIIPEKGLAVVLITNLEGVTVDYLLPHHRKLPEQETQLIGLIFDDLTDRQTA